MFAICSNRYSRSWSALIDMASAERNGDHRIALGRAHRSGLIRSGSCRGWARQCAAGFPAARPGRSPPRSRVPFPHCARCAPRRHGPRSPAPLRTGVEYRTGRPPVIGQRPGGDQIDDRSRMGMPPRRASRGEVDNDGDRIGGMLLAQCENHRSSGEPRASSLAPPSPVLCLILGWPWRYCRPGRAPR
jgi:hypothetical protein